MIANEAELALVLEQLSRVNAALESLRADVQHRNPRNFAIMAESYVSDRDALFAEVDTYLADQNPTQRGELIFQVFNLHPGMSKEGAARLAAIVHLAIATEASGFPGGPKAHLALIHEVFQDELKRAWGLQLATPPADEPTTAS